MPKRILKKNKYQVVGELQRMDQADTIIARRDLVPDSELWQRYYQKFPELEGEGRGWAELQASQFRRTGIPPQDTLMASAIYSTIHALSAEELVDGKPAPEKIVIDPGRASQKIKGFAHHLGADLVGIGPLNQAWTYSRTGRSGNTSVPIGTTINLPHQHAIVVAVHYERDDIECAPHFHVGLATLEIYIRLSAIVVTLGQYIRSLGYSARAHNFNFQVMDIPLAIDAGFGELARNGILITEEYGNNTKTMSVTTDLPLEDDKPVDIGVDEFCTQCKICAEICPAGAIPRGDKRVVRGVRKWKIDAEACFKYWLHTGSNCSLCIAYCPWTRPRTFPHNLILKAVERSSTARKIAIEADKVLLREKKRRIPFWLEEYPEVWRGVLKPNHPFYRQRQ